MGLWPSKINSIRSREWGTYTDRLYSDENEVKIGDVVAYNGADYIVVDSDPNKGMALVQFTISIPKMMKVTAWLHEKDVVPLIRCPGHNAFSNSDYLKWLIVNRHIQQSLDVETDSK